MGASARETEGDVGHRPASQLDDGHSQAQVVAKESVALSASFSRRRKCQEEEAFLDDLRPCRL